MIIFNNYPTTKRVLKQINKCINEMIDFELSFYCNEEEIEEGLTLYFPEHLCREDSKKCINVLLELREWTEDAYYHSLTCLHEYALFKIFNSYFDVAEDVYSDNEDDAFQFKIEKNSEYSEEELEVLNQLNDRCFYEESLFEDLDFLDIDEIVSEYQTNSPIFKLMGVNLKYYLDLMPKDIRKEVEESLNIEYIDDEKLIINQIKNAIKLRERYPERLAQMSEDELSDDIKDMSHLILEQNGIIIEREARGGYAKSQVGENDFFLYKIDGGKIKQIAIGENKIWNKFEKQVKQLIGYMNENIMFGFTIVFNKSAQLIDVRNKQIEILEKLKDDSNVNVVDIIKKDDDIISIHINKQNNRKYKIYHLVVNAYCPERKQVAEEVRL